MQAKSIKSLPGPLCGHELAKPVLRFQPMAEKRSVSRFPPDPLNARCHSACKTDNSTDSHVCFAVGLMIEMKTLFGEAFESRLVSLAYLLTVAATKKAKEHSTQSGHSPAGGKGAPEQNHRFGP